MTVFDICAFRLAGAPRAGCSCSGDFRRREFR